MLFSSCARPPASAPGLQESGEGIVFGIRAAGVPELTDMCTMHQMREVSFYYQQAGFGGPKSQP